MRFLLMFVFVAPLLIQSLSIEAQYTTNIIDSVYGLSPLLYNGRLYTYTPARHTKGNPYLSGKEFVRGKVTINGIVYQDIDINYDIYNQQLLLNYKNNNGAALIIELSKSWLEGFSMGNTDFEYKPNNEGQISMLQVIKSDSVQVNYFWKKELQLDNVYGAMTYAFSKPRRQQFINFNGDSKYYRTNKDFVRVFPQKVQKQLTGYLRMNKIKVKKATDEKMLELVKYCNSLLTP